MHHRFLCRQMLSFVLAALLPAAALAQQPAGTPPVPRPACIPLVNGYPTSLPRYEWGQQGWHIFWACSDIKAAPATWYAISCLHNVCSLKTLSAVLTQITRASAKVSTANALWDQHIAFDCAAVRQEPTQRGALCRERTAIFRDKLPGWAQ